MLLLYLLLLKAAWPLPHAWPNFRLQFATVQNGSFIHEPLNAASVSNSKMLSDKIFRVVACSRYSSPGTSLRTIFRQAARVRSRRFIYVPGRTASILHHTEWVVPNHCILIGLSLLSRYLYCKIPATSFFYHKRVGLARFSLCYLNFRVVQPENLILTTVPIPRPNDLSLGSTCAWHICSTAWHLLWVSAIPLVRSIR